MAKKYLLIFITGSLLLMLSSPALANDTENSLKNILENHFQDSISYYKPGSLQIFKTEKHTVIMEKEDKNMEERQKEELALYKQQLEDKKKDQLFRALDAILENDGTDKTAGEIQKELNDLLKEEEAAAKAAIGEMKAQHESERKTGKIQEESDILTALVKYTTSRDKIMRTEHTEYLYFAIESGTVITPHNFLESVSVSSFEKQYENFIGTSDNKWLFSIYLIIFAAFMAGTLFWTGVSKYSRSDP
ncbi:hypothetical protein MM300_21300 [Evansella sp. LMS18]|jgi:hypothetical protein|uniref:hypothetical protein n=1 Tax=Evansella sp. LMS18 TaxID=2924033 RepID=UPI0020D1ADA1|nr:hypothetical protein [Evansella sp. LMS18]UTR10375.1 hypothetical protein MM300_21300 [Evansella sp. LMS18]